MAGAPRLAIRDLVKHFPVRRGTFAKARDFVRAVNGVSLDIHDGETVAIVGESGCGKSTIARVILRLERPTSGSIHLNGEDLLAMEDTTAARRAVQLVSQNPWSALNRRKTVKHTLTQPLKVHDLVPNRAERTMRAARLLEEVGLSPDYLYRYPSGISGGELQRVTIARALAVSPDVLILDEPTASLDVSVKASIINLLIELRRLEKLTYLFITHEIDIAKHVSDRIAVMYLGRIVEQGPTERIFEDPKHPYTQSPPRVGAGGGSPTPVRTEAYLRRGAVRHRPTVGMHLPYALPVRLRPMPRGDSRSHHHRTRSPRRVPPGGRHGRLVNAVGLWQAVGTERSVASGRRPVTGGLLSSGGRPWTEAAERRKARIECVSGHGFLLPEAARVLNPAPPSRLLYRIRPDTRPNPPTAQVINHYRHRRLTVVA